jgi:hypothetical protein
VKIFVSYSRTDAGELAEQTQRRFYDSEQYDVFTDVNSIKVGDVWSNTIENNISNCDVFVVIVTHGALQSPHVENEVLQAQREKKRIIPCFHRSVIHSEIKWGLNKIQGVEFEDKYELARNLYSKIAYGMQGRGSMRINQREKSTISMWSTTILRPTGVTIIAILNIIGGVIWLFLSILSIVEVAAQAQIPTSEQYTLFVLALGIPGLVIGYALLKGRGWAWTAAVVSSIIGIGVVSIIFSIISIIFSINIDGVRFVLIMEVANLIIYGVTLYYLYRPHVKAYFGKIVSTSGTASATQA